MAALLHHESIMVSVSGGDQLHLKRIYKDKKQLGSPVFMLHGEAEDGRIFYSTGRSGLGNYLAEQGFDVFVADMRGKGKSWPAVGERSAYGYHQIICDDIPAYTKAIVKKRGLQPQLWMSHGLGGVFMLAYLARFGEALCPVERMVHFGVRRQLQVDNWKKRLVIDWLWEKVAARLVKFNGYLPAKGLRLGTMDESAGCYYDSLAWANEEQWLDSQDQFDYGAAIAQQSLPPSLYFASVAEQVFSHPDDVRNFIHQLGRHDGRLVLLSSEGGNLHDYDHVDMLLHSDAKKDHFPLILEWLENSMTSWMEKEAV